MADRQCIFEGCHYTGEIGSINYKIDNYNYDFTYKVLICTTHRLWLWEQRNLSDKHKAKITVRVID